MPDFGGNNRRDGGRYQGGNGYRGRQNDNDRYRRDDDGGGDDQRGTLRDQVARLMHDDRTSNEAKLMAMVTIQQNILIKKLVMQLSDIADVICATPNVPSGKPSLASGKSQPPREHGDDAGREDDDDAGAAVTADDHHDAKEN